MTLEESSDLNMFIVFFCVGSTWINGMHKCMKLDFTRTQAHMYKESNWIELYPGTSRFDWKIKLSLMFVVMLCHPPFINMSNEHITFIIISIKRTPLNGKHWPNMRVKASAVTFIAISNGGSTKLISLRSSFNFNNNHTRVRHIKSVHIILINSFRSWMLMPKNTNYYL